MLEPLLQLFYPRLCLACQRQPLQRQQRALCTSCQYKIKPTNYHLFEENPVAERFWGRLPITRASTAYHFVKGGILQRLIHELKYGHRPEIGEELGRSYGRLLAEEPFWKSIDYIIPVPLHPKKRHQRGYNQAARWASGLSESLGVPWSEKFLLRASYTESQTRKSREERFANVSDAFVLRQADKLRHKHIMLVDDVMTTGATIEACAKHLLKAQISLSVVCIALAP